MDNIEDRVSLCIKTFERPECVQKLVKSIRKFYPNIKIIIADDSKESIPIENTEYIQMNFYSGTSAGRNAAMNRVKTEYFCTLDDDFMFDKSTRLETWVKILDNTGLDMIGGNVENRAYNGIIDFANNEIKLIPGTRGECDGYKLYDIILQFWCGRTKKIQEIGGWDNDFKTQDHKVFFLRHFGKLKISHTPDVYCHHIRKMPKNYANYRHGMQNKYLVKTLKKFNSNRLVEFGTETARL
jgi:beta-1,4-N-acetylgalactosaminyltransferase 2